MLCATCISGVLHCQLGNIGAVIANAAQERSRNIRSLGRSMTFPQSRRKLCVSARNQAEVAATKYDYSDDSKVADMKVRERAYALL